MKLKAVLKRVVPFGIALLIGAALAWPFASAPSYDSAAEHFKADRELRRENQRLKNENCRMKWRLRQIDRSMRYGHELTVPEPPMAPVEPPPPPAPPAPPASK